ncbi:MarR family winged helix-turn-helix transcriptional regulator (plasmid) [Shimia sp. W99]
MSDTSASDLFLRSLPALNRQLSRELAFALRPLRVSHAQFLIIDLLLKKGDLPPRRISEALMLDQSTVVSTLTRMERDGLISRAEDPDDGRSVLIQLTDRSKDLAGNSRQAVCEVVQQYSEKLSRSELEELDRLLGKLLD